MSVPFRVVIPARYASTRLPAKALADVCGVPLVLRVYNQARRSAANEVRIATDHSEIAAVAAAAGAPVSMTRTDHASGTDRLAEVARCEGWDDDDLVVNVQGDEPLIDPVLIDALAAALHARPQAAIATACHALEDATEFFNPNVVKVVCDAAGRALYFSRAPIPWARDAFAVGSSAQSQPLPPQLGARRHIGIYAYRVSFLRAYADLPPSPLEGVEALEQLRALWHGYQICVIEAERAPAAGVDTPEDLQRVRALFDSGESAQRGEEALRVQKN